MSEHGDDDLSLLPWRGESAGTGDPQRGNMPRRGFNGVETAMRRRAAKITGVCECALGGVCSHRIAVARAPRYRENPPTHARVIKRASE